MHIRPGSFLVLIKSGSFIPFPAVFSAAHFFVIKVIHNGGMPLLYPLARRFIIHEAAAVWGRQRLCSLFQHFKIGAVSLAVKFLIQRYQMRIVLKHPFVLGHDAGSVCR